MERRNPFRVAHQIREGSLIPRVAKAQPWAEIREHLRCCPSDPSGIPVPKLPKLNPGLKFANTFGVALPNVCGFSPEVPKPPP